MKDTFAMGGYRKIYEDLIERLQYADIATSAMHLGLSLNDAGEARVPFLDTTFLVSNEGVRRLDGKGFNDEFPARTTLLFDLNATQFVDFEVLAVLVTIFVRFLGRA